MNYAHEIVGTHGGTLLPERAPEAKPLVCIGPTNLLEEICHFNTQKYENLFSQARSSRFLYVGYSLAMNPVISCARLIVIQL